MSAGFCFKRYSLFVSPCKRSELGKLGGDGGYKFILLDFLLFSSVRRGSGSKYMQCE